VKAALIVNPNCRLSDDAIRTVESVSRSQSWQPPLLLPTTSQETGGAQARQALAAGVDRIVVAGGDGTLRQVAGALAQAGDNRPALGIMPVGAANLVARNLGLKPGQLKRSASIALTGQPVRLAIGWVSCRIGGLWQDEQPMLAVSGIGWDAQAIAATRPWLKKRAGWLAYAESGGRQARRENLSMKISHDGNQEATVQAWSILFAILPRLPLGIVAFPDVVPGSDIAQVLQVTISQPARWGAVAAKGLLHTRGQVDSLHYSSARRLIVKPSQPCPVQIDGDAIEEVEEVRFRVQPSAIEVHGFKKRSEF